MSALLNVRPGSKGPNTVIVTVRDPNRPDHARQFEMPISYRRFVAGLKRWDEGMLIQRAFPELTDGQREILLTGHTDEEWDELFPEEEE